MKKAKKKYKSVIDMRIFQSLKKIGLIFGALFFVLIMGKIGGTNAFLADSATVSGNVFSAGYWIPELHMSVNPTSPDGENGFYKTTPCVTLSADIKGQTSGLKIYYKFSNDEDPVSSGTLYAGVCIPIPDGDPTRFEAIAVNDENPDWTSDVITQNFKVDTSHVGHGYVIINEVMWAGSRNLGDPSDDGPNDQWVELKNVSGKDLHLKDWYLTYKEADTGNEVKLAEIANNRVVKDGEYFLLSNYDKSNSAIDEQRDDDMEAFDYSKFQIRLYTDKSRTTLVDTAGDGTKTPTKGDKDNFYSMERKHTPGDGSDYDNWYNCEDARSTGLYWDRDSSRTERGTPGHANLSKNDPTSPDYDPTETPVVEITTTVTDTTIDESGDVATDIEDPVATDKTDASENTEEATGEDEAIVDPIISEENPTDDDGDNSDAIIEETATAGEEVAETDPVETTKLVTIKDEEKKKEEIKKDEPKEEAPTPDDNPTQT